MQAAADAGDGEQDKPLEGWRVLVVDDREGVRAALQSQLMGSGADTSVAASEEEALSMLRDAAGAGTPFAVAIIDRVRPNVDGLAVCRTIRKDPTLTHTAIVSIMSINWRAMPEQLEDPRTGVMLSKPVRRSELLNAIAGSVATEAVRMLVAPAAGVQDPSEAAGLPDFGMRVLLAEDNPVNQEVAREFLSLFGCDTVLAENGVEAIEQFEKATFDIVLMDCQMPMLDGLSATRRIREIERRTGATPVKIVAVTANAFDSDKAAALEAGMDDFLTKPFSDEQLGAILQKWQSKAAGKAAA